MPVNIRQPANAGTFYESSSVSCQYHAAKLLDEAEIPESLAGRRLFGGVVPHAGLMDSGHVAAQVFKALAAEEAVHTLVLLGADHRGLAQMGEVFDSGIWVTPLGEVHINEYMASALVANSGCLRSHPEAHVMEHSIEVQIPLIQEALPEVQIVPIAVPATAVGVKIGRAIGETIAREFPAARVVASSDLTHHGGHFPAPGGRGQEGVTWTEDNDLRMMKLIEAMKADEVVPEAKSRQNACGAGAISAAIVACSTAGASEAIILSYTNSYHVVHELYPDDPDDTTVGYASAVFV